jgi:Ni2+-binding GTPase involved in maturation of urease and hydrogenase
VRGQAEVVAVVERAVKDRAGLLLTGSPEVSTTIAFRIAKLLEVSLHDVLEGSALPKKTCPHCGKVIP